MYGLRIMKLTIVYHSPLFFDGKIYHTIGPLGRHITSLLRYFDKLILCMPVEKSNPTYAVDYPLTDKRIEICPLPPFRNMIQIIMNTPKVIHIILANINKWQLINLRIPSYYEFYVFLLARLFSKPVFLFTLGDARESYKAMKFKGLKKLLSIVYVSLLEATDKFMVKRTIVFTNGKSLYQKYCQIGKATYETIEATLHDAEVKNRIKPKDWSGTINLLYVGRLYEEKGIEYLLEAVSIMRANKINVKLHIVGSGRLESVLKHQCKQKNILDVVHFLGYVPHGSQLFEIYRESHIFVLPSLTEGVPRVLVEAMANGLPVIATDVGGVSSAVQNQHTGILIEPANPKMICDAVQKIISDNVFALKLAQNALDFAKEHTLEKQAAKMVQILASHYQYLRKVK